MITSPIGFSASKCNGGNVIIVYIYIIVLFIIIIPITSTIINFFFLVHIIVFFLLSLFIWLHFQSQLMLKRGAGFSDMDAHI